MAETTKLLFVCTGNRDRSPTAEVLFRSRRGLEVKSAGTSAFAAAPVTRQLVDWADAVIVMEGCHEALIRANYADAGAGKLIFCLGIADQYRFMDDRLVREIRERMGPILAGLVPPPNRAAKGAAP